MSGLVTEIPASLAWVKGVPPLLLHSTVLLVVAKSYVVRQSVAGRNQSAGRQESSHSDQPVLAVAETRTARPSTVSWPDSESGS